MSKSSKSITSSSTTKSQKDIRSEFSKFGRNVETKGEARFLVECYRALKACQEEIGNPYTIQTFATSLSGI
jgi:hypothetical protein